MQNSTLIIIIISSLLFLLVFFYWPDTKEKTIYQKEMIKIQSPELSGLTNWMNSEEIKSIESLKGKVVLVDFWTYSCINCIRTFSYLEDLQQKYADDGLVILGIHAPEFSFERKPENVAQALKQYGLTYPVALDNNFETWKNFKNRYWPAKYLIDKDGFIVYTHFGEGEYIETENKVRQLLGLDNISGNSNQKLRKEKTSETYLGTSRRENFKGVNFTGILEKNTWTISDGWQENKEKIYSQINNKEIFLKMNIKAGEANVVMGGNAQVEVFIDGIFTKKIDVNKNDLYNIFNFEDEKLNNKEYKERMIELKFTGQNIEVFAWTFG